MEILFDRILKLVSYSESSSSGLVWNNTTFRGRYNKIPNTVKGENAGWLSGGKNHKKYWYFKINGKAIAVSKIVYFIFNPNFDQTMVVDHIDGDSTNNNISNLRLVTSTQNAQNRKLSKNNTSDLLGVRRFTVGKLSYWEAEIMVDKKKYRERFSVEKLGEEKARTLAILKREQFVSYFNLNEKSCFKEFKTNLGIK